MAPPPVNTNVGYDNMNYNNGIDDFYAQGMPQGPYYNDPLSRQQ